MGAVSAFTTENYSRQPVVVCLFVKPVNMFFILEFKSDVIKDVSSAKMSHSFTVVKVLMKCTLFAFSPFLFLLMESQGCSMLLLKLVMEKPCKVCLSITSNLDAH